MQITHRLACHVATPGALSDGGRPNGYRKQELRWRRSAIRQAPICHEKPAGDRRHRGRLDEDQERICDDRWPKLLGCCFLRGTEIRTLDGHRKVEDIAAGDVLPTLFGGTRVVQWIGHYRYKRSDAAKPWVEEVRPIRVARSAIAPNVPSRDLYVTREHCFYIDGVLIRAGSLVNGTTIVVDAAEQWDELEYFHIKLERHDVVYAEDLACEVAPARQRDCGQFR